MSEENKLKVNLPLWAKVLPWVGVGAGVFYAWKKKKSVGGYIGFGLLGGVLAGIVVTPIALKRSAKAIGDNLTNQVKDGVSKMSAPTNSSNAKTTTTSNNLNTREGKMGFIMNGMIEMVKNKVNDSLKSSTEKPPKSELDKLDKGINELKKVSPSEFIKNIEKSQEKPISDSDLDTWVKYAKAVNDPIYKTLENDKVKKEKFLTEKYNLTKEELKKEGEFTMFAMFSVMLGGKPATLEMN
jgi:hypothetical protein